MRRNRNIGKIVVLTLLAIFVLIAVFAPFLANDQKLICKKDSELHFPVIDGSDISDCDFSLHPIIRYRYNNIDENNANFAAPNQKQFLLPGQQKHLLGTDQLGRDVASGMIHGSRVALLTGGLSMSIALIIGLFFGLFGAFYGNNSFQVKRKTILIFLIILSFLFYLLAFKSFVIQSAISFILLLLAMLCIVLFIHFAGEKNKYFSKKIIVPLDLIFSNFIEIFQSLPGSFLILILVSLFSKASIFNVILVIGLLRWPMIARYVRAEMLKIKEQRYIEASKAIGMSDWRIIFRHALPATLTPVIVAVAFGFSSAILLESALSFLGIGLPVDHVSFGSMLSEARSNYEAWWLAIFPGLAIFCLVYIFNYLGDMLSKQISKK